MNIPIVLLNPRMRFQQIPQNVSQHRDMIAGSIFDKSADAALAQYSADLAMQNKDQMSAMAMGLKITGALEFLQQFKNLGVLPSVTERVKGENLDHKA